MPNKQNVADDDDIQFEMPGVKAKAPASVVKDLRGSAGVVVLLVLLIGGAVYHHQATMDGQQRIAEALESNTYVISRPQEERERMNITMPDSLRRKLDSGRR